MPEPEQEVLSQSSLAVVNGSPSAIENVVQVFIYLDEFGGDASGCSGTVVATRWVLTAKHCTEDATEEDLEIVTPSGIRSRVEAIHGHPESLVDVALLRLSDHLTLPTTTYPLFQGPIEDADGRVGRIVGYGSSSFSQGWVDQVIGQRRSSDRLLEYFPGPDGETTTFGDSGAPVFVDVNHTPHIVGVHTDTFPGDEGEGIAEYAGYFHDWAIDLIVGTDEGGEPLEDRGKPRIAAYASQEIRINDRAQVTWDEQFSTTRPACNSGNYSCASVAHGSTSSLGTDVRLLSVLGRGRVTLRNRARVLGHLVTNLVPDIQQGASIEGDLFITLSTWPHNVQTGGLQLGINPAFEVTDKTSWFVSNQTGDVSLPPGTWASPVIQSGFKLILTEPGNYIFHHLTVEPGAEVVAPGGDQITRIYVFGDLNPKGLIHGGSASNTLLAVPYATYFSVDGTVRATVVAPHARVDLKHGQQANFFSKNLELHQGNTIRAATNPVHPNYWGPNSNWDYGQ